MSAAVDPEPPAEINVKHASVARMYDYYLGGTHNFAADRAAVARVRETLPNIVDRVAEGRALQRRVLRYMCFQGINQFIDIGSGLPTADNTHAVVQRVIPGARVVYSDVDKSAMVYGRAILKHDGNVAFVQGSATELEAILSHPETIRLIDFNRPVGVVMMGLLHFFSFDQGHEIVQALHKRLVLGSLIGISHGCFDVLSNKANGGLVDAYAKASTDLYPRGHQEIYEMLGDHSLVEPGLVQAHEWRMYEADPGEMTPLVTHAWYGGVIIV